MTAVYMLYLVLLLLIQFLVCTHTHLSIQWPYVRDYAGGLVPEETFTNSYQIHPGTPSRTRGEVVEKFCQERKLNREDAVDRSRWRKLMSRL